ncbi:DUF6053 domain-containing protein [Lysobacter yananisis]|uniref:DUF6053 domain-containing protein n=1 Tax=Lysobacter yananisis TaxID=1003114 RepID=UPI003CE5B80A
MRPSARGSCFCWESLEARCSCFGGRALKLDALVFVGGPSGPMLLFQVAAI